MEYQTEKVFVCPSTSIERKMKKIQGMLQSTLFRNIRREKNLRSIIPEPQRNDKYIRCLKKKNLHIKKNIGGYPVFFWNSVSTLVVLFSEYQKLHILVFFRIKLRTRV